MAVKAVLFDLDGTVMDSSRIVLDAWQETFRQLTGKEGDYDVIRKTFGKTLVDCMKEIFPHVPVERSAGIYRDYQMAQGDDHWKLFPGMKDLVIELKDRGYLVGVVTSRVKKTTMRALRKFGLEDEFHALMTADDSHIHKPRPEPALICLEKLGVAPEDAVMIGDSIYDIACAHNAGMPAILVSWTISTDEEDKMGIYKPDFEANSPERILEIIESL